MPNAARVACRISGEDAYLVQAQDRMVSASPESLKPKAIVLNTAQNPVGVQDRSLPRACRGTQSNLSADGISQLFLVHLVPILPCCDGSTRGR